MTDAFSKWVIRNKQTGTFWCSGRAFTGFSPALDRAYLYHTEGGAKSAVYQKQLEDQVEVCQVELILKEPV